MTLIISGIEYIFGASLFLNALLFIPQIIILLKKKTTTDISLITFFGFCFIQSFTIMHGYINKDYILMWGYVLSLITCGTTTFLIIYYQIKNKKLNI